MAQRDMSTLHYFLIVMIAGGLVACGNKDKQEAQMSLADSTVSYSPVVNLPPPDEKASNVKYSKVIGWPENQTPRAAAGFTVTQFATVLKSPRNIYVAPNGDIFVSLANTEAKGFRKVKDAVTGRDESQHTSKSVNQIYLFRDADGDGKPEIETPYLTGLSQPFGMLVIGNFFYVANTDGVWRYPYNEKETKIISKGTKIVDLPAGGYNNHWTRNLTSNADGTRIYIAVGSASNAAEHGMDEEVLRANILEINTDGSDRRIFASGLRNPVGMDWEPGTNALWTVVNERDKLGDDLVPDYLTRVKDGGFYGWPYAYFGQNLDPRIKEKDQKPELVKQTIIPDFALDSHSASMGLIFGDHPSLPSKYHNGAFVTQHGSWNRATFTGYRVIFIPFANGSPSGPAEDFLTGFIADADKGEVYGRPVATAITKDGALLVTDDASDVIWRVKYDMQ
jgi:glucose/arabinose dehydrogenase